MLKMRETVRRKRLVRVALTAVITLTMVVGYVVLDVRGYVPGSVSIINELRRNGSVAALMPQQNLQNFGKATVASSKNMPIDEKAAQSLIDATMSEIGEGNTAAAVIADKKGKIIAQSQMSTVLEPASTMKTLTGFAASVLLDPQQTLDTKAMFEPNGTSQAEGTVTLVGGGDILLGSGSGDKNHVTGHAGLADLAAQAAQSLTQRGVKSVTVQYDDSLFNYTSLPNEISGNSDLNANYTNVMEPASMAIDEARKSSSSPVNPDDERMDYPPRSATPAEDVTRVFAQALGQQGIAVSNSSFNHTAAGDGAVEIGKVSSAPLYEIIGLMLRNSDNSLAQLLGRLLALHTGQSNDQAGAAKAVAQTIAQYGIPTDGLTVADTSGLMPGSRVSVLTLVQVQSAYLNTASLTWQAAAGLPINGLNGTLKNRDFGLDARGLVRAKTGTLDAAVSLAGNVSRLNGGALTFAIIVNGADMYTGRVAIDHFAAGLAKL